MSRAAIPPLDNRLDPSTDAPGRPPRRSTLAWLLLRAASFIVPRPARRRWLDEWTAELWMLDNRPGEARSLTPLALSLGALPHSLWQRKEWAMSLIVDDARFAVRALRRNPGFTALALITVALGVGANTTIFSMANATLVRGPEGIEAPERVVQIGRDRPDEGFDNLAYPVFEQFRHDADGLDALAAYTSRPLIVGRGAEVNVLPGQLVTGDYFSLLGVDAAAGRLLGGVDDQAGAATAVISHALWTSRYGADPGVIGRRVRINGSDFDIVGVAERGFAGTDVVSSSTDIWLPLSMASTALGPLYAGQEGNHGFSWLWLVGRLAPDTGAAALRAELNGLYKPAFAQRWGQPADHDIGVIVGVGLRPGERTDVSRLMIALMAVVAVVLAVACANLANLLLARGIGRSRELGIRAALGASRGRLVRGLLVESVVLALAGGLLALLVTFWTVRLLPPLLPAQVSVSFRPDLTVFAFALAVSLMAGVLFGLLPAWRSARQDPTASFQESSPLGGSKAGGLRGGLVVGQIALSFALLAVTALMVQSLVRAAGADPGYDPERVMTMTVDLDLAGYEPGRGRPFLDELRERAAALPGARAAALGSNLPFAGWRRESVYLPRERPDLERPFIEIDAATVDGGYFETLGIPLLRGETFTATNAAEGMPPVVVISESAARLLWPGEEAVGRLLPRTEARTPEESLRVVGVVADVQVRSLREGPRPSIYRPLSQGYEGRVTVFVRTAGAPEPLAAPLRALVEDIDPDLGILQVGSLHDRMSASLRDTNAMARIGGIFGLLAGILAAVGLYGVVAYVVSSRTFEIGVRIALGADRFEVVGLFLRQALLLTAIGVVVGTLLMLAAGRGVASFLYGVSPTEPLTLGAIAAGIIAMALAAAAVPAMRASRVDPVAALRRR